jgi:DNA-binding PucR family transcriptional regulator
MREVAVCYLKNNRNCTLTAAMLNLHRNTLLYKIQKIEDLLGESLDNPELQQRLLFSNTVVEYILKVQQSNPLSFDNHFTAL